MMGSLVRTLIKKQLQELFAKAGFLLRKWRCSSPAVLQNVSLELRDQQIAQSIPDADSFVKTLGLEWNSSQDCFRLTVSEIASLRVVTKRALISDVAKIFDVLGWFAPCVVKMKILLQTLWESKVGWDDPVGDEVEDSWKKWRMELPLLSNVMIPRCYFPKHAHVVSVQLHGFSDASESAYAGVVYIRMVDSDNDAYVSLLMSKTKVAPIKRLTIPRLELCGAYLLAKILSHVKEVLHVPAHNVFAWTDSMIVLGWLDGSPRRFKTFVGNRVSGIMDLISPDRWRHVSGVENPADCASRGLFPSEIIEHHLWWHGPEWLLKTEDEWPIRPVGVDSAGASEEKEVCAFSSFCDNDPLPIVAKFSSLTRLKRVTAWVRRFINNCILCRGPGNPIRGSLSVKELWQAEKYWLKVAQESAFSEDILFLKKGKELLKKSTLLPLRPFLDDEGLLRVGGRENQSYLSYNRRHPIVLPGFHGVTKLIVYSEHLRLLHAGPTLVCASLSRVYHIVSSRRVVRSITRSCVVCRRVSAKPKPQMLGQLPLDRMIPGSAFDRVGVDYAGPVLIKCGSKCKPVLFKAYISVFVSFSIKAVHLELVSDLTTATFIAALRRFIARRGKPMVIWSDNGSNFVGAARELKELRDFLHDSKTQRAVSDYCTCQKIHWKFIPEHSPHFGGLWEAAVKSAKLHLKKVVGEVKLTYEELCTVLSQVEACLNSRPLVALPNDEDGIEALTPGHFLVGKPLEALPDPSSSYLPCSLLRRWQLCQSMVRGFWQRWSVEYLSQLQKMTKWKLPSRNIHVGDLVAMHEDNLVPTKWPLARVLDVHPGRDGMVRVVTLKTSRGTYKRPVAKIVLVLPTNTDFDSC